jgi:ADP-heptose:LPS heptosyltransferase
VLSLVAGGPGIGDALVLSAIAHEWKRQRSGDLVEVVAEGLELLENNPDIDIRTRWGGSGRQRSFPELDNQGVFHESNVRTMCRKFGLEPPASEVIQPYLYLRPDELHAPGNYITIHNQPGPWTRTKDWPQYDWQQLVNRLIADGLEVVQIGGPGDPPLCGANRLLGLPLRESASMINSAACHVSCVSGTMHMAAALRTPSVIIFGGREDPVVTGYMHQRNLVGKTHCSPCWIVGSCPIGYNANNEARLPCMDLIPVDMVYTAIKETYKCRMD